LLSAEYETSATSLILMPMGNSSVFAGKYMSYVLLEILRFHTVYFNVDCFDAWKLCGACSCKLLLIIWYCRATLTPVAIRMV